MHIRAETPADIPHIDRICRAAFGGDEEARLIKRLRAQNIALISLVAEEGHEIIGHILFSPVTLAENRSIQMAGLAPMAVTPSWQNQGIGSRLLEHGLACCRNSGYEAVVVLGHPNYYPRFGFVPSTHFGMRSEYQVPDEVFMIKELKAGALKGLSGIIQYHPCFKEC